MNSTQMMEGIEVHIEGTGPRTLVMIHGWPEYWRIREERKAAGIEPAAPPTPQGPKSEIKGPGPLIEASPEIAKEPSKNARKKEQQLEKAVEEAEAALAKLEEELADPAAWATKYESAKNQARHTAAKRAVEQAYAALEEHMAAYGL